jgi:outer membrane phospholipase A
MRPFFAALACLVVTAVAAARVDLLLLPPAAPVSGNPGTEFILHLNNPTERAVAEHLPAVITAQFASATGSGRVRLEPVDPPAGVRTVPAMSRATVVLRLADAITGPGGFVSLRLTTPVSNAIMFEHRPEPTGVAATNPATATPAAATSRRSLDLTTDIESMRRHISGYDPIYFAVGWRERFNARFQLSFKYRVLDPGGPEESLPAQLARELYFAYTQTSIWDLESFSKPFYDSSYKPTVFLLHAFTPDPAGPWRFSLQGGVQHESNGKGGGSSPTLPAGGLVSSRNAQRHTSDSRSLNSIYLAPTLRWGNTRDHFVEARARLSGYFDLEDNRDLARYRGYVELTLRGGHDRGFQASLQARGKIDGHGSLELNFTWPTTETPLLRRVISPALGGYAQIQYFNGYGESLLDYDVRRKDQLRFGFLLVR